LANGRDLQSLLAEERFGRGNQASDERLRIMPAPRES
jgi:pre-mRNA-splicing factor 18